MAQVDKLGKPGVMVDTKPFKADSEAAAKTMGLPDLPIVALSMATVAGKPDADVRPVAQEAMQAVIDGLTKPPAKAAVAKETEFKASRAGVLTFEGRTADEAQEAMEKFFLAGKMSDGNPMVPPTPERVAAMLKATSLPPDHVVGILNPRHGVATVERIAVNAVMAGCRPAYLPVLIALAEACADPAFDLHGVLVTGGLTAPLVIVSGPVVKDINLNYSYSTLGPGWRANTTIGRASRLLFINISQAWPGVNDMKELGNPAKFGMVMAENDDQTPAGWATMREREGFPKDASTVSIYACVSFRQFHDSQKYLGKPATKVDPHIARQLATSLNATAEQWGEEIIVAFGPVQANNMAKLGYTPEKIQEELWTEGRIERKLFGPRPLGAFAVGSNIPAWIDEAPDDAMIPVVPTAKDVKIIVAGGSGPGTGFVIDRWGFGNSKLVTKKVALPANWPALVGDLKGWETPIEVK